MAEKFADVIQMPAAIVSRIVGLKQNTAEWFAQEAERQSLESFK